MDSNAAGVTRRMCEEVFATPHSRLELQLASDVMRKMEQLERLHAACEVKACPVCAEIRTFEALN